MAKAFPNTGVTIIDSSSDLTGFSPSEGLMVFQKDTNELKIYDGANWKSVVDTDTPPSLQFIGSYNFSSNPSDITGCFTGNYLYYRLMFTAVSNTNENLMYFRFLNGTTPITATSYRWTGMQAYVGAIVSSGGSNADTVWPVMQFSSTNYSTAFVDIMGPDWNQNKTYVAHNVHHQAGGTIDSRYFVGAFSTGNGPYTGFRLFANTGTISGVVNVYGYRGS